MRTHRLLVLMPVSVVMLCVGVLTAQGISFGMPGAVKNKARELKDNRDRETIQRIPSLGTKSTTAGKGSKVRFVCEPGPGPAVAGYEWTASGGMFVSTGSVAVWVAPEVTGVYTISCRVTDIAGKVFQRSTTIPVRDPGTVKWTYPGNVRGCPAIAEDGTIYFCDTGGALHSVNPDGTANWVHPGAGMGPVIGEDGIIYTAGGSNVYAFTAAGLAWTVEIGGDVRSTPILDDSRKTIYVYNAAGVRAVDVVERVVKWGVSSGFPTTIGPDGVVYTSLSYNYNDYLRAYNPDGSIKWESPATSYVGVEYFAASTVSVYFVHAARPTPGPIRKLSANNGSVLWDTSAGGSVPVVDKTGIYTGGNWYDLVSVNLVTGDTTVIGSSVQTNARSMALGIDNMLYFTEMNKLTAFSIEDGQVAFSVPMAMQGIDSYTKYPTIAFDGTLYVGSVDGLLYAIQGTGYLSEDAIWPKWRRDLRNTGCATTR